MARLTPVVGEIPNHAPVRTVLGAALLATHQAEGAVKLLDEAEAIQSSARSRKLLSDEVDEKAWDSYLKGNRGVFTRRAVRLLEGSETRAIKAHYEADIEFQDAVHRYVHDFEAMMRRVVADKDGGIIAVTLMSSDTGKLYAALAQVVDKRR